ncbi:hypothetical protein [Streptomyces sp. NPDC057686]|uniref:hypothetical protein n=1 Tax=Streptomyces sp. NPDC057686 TaxID=3346212 RepID=UPI003685AB16
MLPVDDERTVLRHTLSMRVTGVARLSRPLAYRWLHDAVLEDSLDRAGKPARCTRWSPCVRLLMAIAPKEH